MADQPNPAAAPSNPPANSGGGGGAFQVPAGQRLITEDDFGKFQRYEQQVRGLTPLAERAARHGFSKPEDFDAIAPWQGIIKKATERKMTPAAFEPFLADPSAPGGGQVDFDPEEFSTGVLTRAEQAATKAAEHTYALREHEAAVRAEPELFKRVAREQLGKDADEFDIENFAGRLKSTSKRPEYPAGHPLAGEHYSAFTEKHLEETAKALKKQFEDHRAKSISDKAKALSKSSPSSIAGDHAQQGKPETTDDRRPGGRPSVSKVEAVYAAKVAARQRP